MRKLAGERFDDVIDSVGHGIGIVDGELRAVFRDGHLRKFEAIESRAYSMDDLRRLDEELGLGPTSRSDTL